MIASTCQSPAIVTGNDAPGMPVTASALHVTWTVPMPDTGGTNERITRATVSAVAPDVVTDHWVAPPTSVTGESWTERSAGIDEVIGPLSDESGNAPPTTSP